MTASVDALERDASSLDVRCDTSFGNRLDAEWDQLLAESHTNTVFLTSGWLRAWHETLGRQIPLVIPQIRIDGKLIAAAAFQISKGVVEFAGSGPSDYSDFLVSKSLDVDLATQVIERLLQEARHRVQGFRHFKLGRIQPESPTTRSTAGPASQFRSTVIGRVPAPFMDMTAAGDRLRKKSLRRHERGLQGRGMLSSETFSRARDILPMLDEFFAQHVERWRSSGEQSLFLRDDNRELYRRITERLEPSGQVRFTTVRLDGKLVAAHFGFLHASRFIWYKPTFDPTLAKLSPGEVLIKRLIEQAQSEGASVFDFTVGDEPFKRRFATGVRELVYLYVSDSRVSTFTRRARVFMVKNVRGLLAMRTRPRTRR